MERSEVAIIIPAYNEEKTIGDVVNSIKSYGDIIVVNDCSSDQTALLAQQAGAIIVNHETNQGYDGALNSGFAKALNLNKEYLLTFDADGQHDHTLIKVFLEALQDNNDLVLGVRPKKARISETFIGLYFRFRFGIHDILCGMKGYRAELVKKNNGFDHINSIGSELSFSSIKKGARFKQIHVPIFDRQDTPRFGNILKSNLKIIAALLRIILLDLRLKSKPVTTLTQNNNQSKKVT